MLAVNRRTARTVSARLGRPIKPPRAGLRYGPPDRTFFSGPGPPTRSGYGVSATDEEAIEKPNGPHCSNPSIVAVAR